MAYLSKRMWIYTDNFLFFQIIILLFLSLSFTVRSNHSPSLPWWSYIDLIDAKKEKEYCYASLSLSLSHPDRIKV